MKKIFSFVIVLRIPLHRVALPQEAEGEGREQAGAISAVRHAGIQLSCVLTDMKDEMALLTWFYSQHAGAENLIKEANNDAGLAAHPSGRFETNRNYF